MEELYAHFGLEWSANVRDRMHNYLQNHPREKHGKHAYTLEQFGLSHEQLAPCSPATATDLAWTVEGA